MADQRNELRAEDIERGLQRLVVKSSSVDRDRLMYLAGQQSAGVSSRASSAWVWKSLTILSTAAAVLLAVGFADTYHQLRSLRMVIVGENGATDRHPLSIAGDDLSTPIDDAGVDASFSMLALRDAVIRQGVDALPARRSVRGDRSPSSYWDQVQAIEQPDKFARPVLEGVKEQPGLWGQVMGWGEKL